MKASLLSGWLGDRILRDLVVEDTASLAPAFIRIVLAAPWVRERPPEPGDKVQVFLPGVGSRTFTPFAVDASAGRFSLIAFLHDTTPASDWARALQPGSTVRVLGPRSSTPVAPLAGPVALFGDETSLGIARALLDAHPRDSLVRLEVSPERGTAEACAALSLSCASLTARRAGEFHLDEIASALAAPTIATVLLTGSARSIQGLRARLRATGARQRQVTRAYWAEGKSGLD
ncbi:MAG TPA: siderophore-interacting protein [Polyangiaceae bacterium]|nr:siderophore-interacting protein [Polyangiaceae bacterium]